MPCYVRILFFFTAVRYVRRTAVRADNKRATTKRLKWPGNSSRKPSRTTLSDGWFAHSRQSPFHRAYLDRRVYFARTGSETCSASLTGQISPSTENAKNFFLSRPGVRSNRLGRTRRLHLTRQPRYTVINNDYTTRVRSSSVKRIDVFVSNIA